MRSLVITAALLSLALSRPAWACQDPAEVDDRRISDRVVEGRIRCDRETNRCLVSVARSLKPRGRSHLEDRRLSVRSEYGARAAWLEEGAIVLTCPGPFEPEVPEFFGRFYLIYDEESELYRVRRYYVRDRDGEFYHLGIRCDPWVTDENGLRSQTCGSVELQ